MTGIRGSNSATSSASARICLDTGITYYGGGGWRARRHPSRVRKVMSDNSADVTFPGRPHDLNDYLQRSSIILIIVKNTVYQTCCDLKYYKVMT